MKYKKGDKIRVVKNIKIDCLENIENGMELCMLCSMADAIKERRTLTVESCDSDDYISVEEADECGDMFFYSYEIEPVITYSWKKL